MVERKTSLIGKASLARESIGRALKQENTRRQFNGYGTMLPWEKLAFVISCLKSEELKKLIEMNHSVNHGRWILDQVFPLADNPERFNSTEFEVCLTDSPVQALGWKEKGDLVETGIKGGLSKDWIDFGFEERAAERGIDLEWHFFSEPHRAENFLDSLKRFAEASHKES